MVINPVLVKKIAQALAGVHDYWKARKNRPFFRQEAMAKRIRDAEILCRHANDELIEMINGDDK